MRAQLRSLVVHDRYAVYTESLLPTKGLAPCAAGSPPNLSHRSSRCPQLSSATRLRRASSASWLCSSSLPRASMLSMFLSTTQCAVVLAPTFSLQLPSLTVQQVSNGLLRTPMIQVVSERARVQARQELTELLLLLSCSTIHRLKIL